MCAYELRRTGGQVRELTKLKRALVIERILRHIQYDHCNPFPSPMTPAAAQRLRQVLDCKDLYVLTDASAARILLLEHVHRDIGEDKPESHSYLGVFTSSDCLEKFINASNLGHAANVRVVDGRTVFGTLKEVRLPSCTRSSNVLQPGKAARAIVPSSFLPRCKALMCHVYLSRLPWHLRPPRLTASCSTLPVPRT